MKGEDTTPDRGNQTTRLEDGRTLGYADYGDAAGKVVFNFNGSGGSRLEHPWDSSILADLGVRLVSTDRPGHGLSDPKLDRRLLDWPDDISQLADHLGVDRFYVMGSSAGGPHALACAYKLPERVLAGAIISGLAPPERANPYKGLPFPNRTLMFGARRLPVLLYLLRRMTYRMVMGDPEEVGKRLAMFFPPVDRQLVELADNRKRFVLVLQEGYRQGWRGPAQDDIIVNRPWGFRLEDIAVRIDIWQGEADRNVPLDQAHYQHERIPSSRLMVMPGQAHLYLLAEWRAVLASLLE